MTAPMTPAPVSAPGQEVPPPSPAPGQDPNQPQPQTPQPQDQQQGQSATDAAADDADPMVWLTAAELDSRFESVNRPTLQNGVMG